MNLKIIIAGIIGIICGLITTHSFFAHSWATLIFWGLVGIIFGLYVQRGREAMWSGIVYGFLVTLIFLISGFKGTSDKLPGFLLLTLVLSVIGSLCGFVLVWIGSRIRGM